jgi:hypothetical protein
MRTLLGNLNQNAGSVDAGICYRLVILCLKQKNPLIEAFTAPGDSGSWVVGAEPYPGVRYGSVVASSISSQITYIIPGYRILLDVEQTFGNGKALLATEDNIKNVDVDREEITQPDSGNPRVVLRQPHWIRALNSHWANVPISPSELLKPEHPSNSCQSKPVQRQQVQYVQGEAEYNYGLGKSSPGLVFYCCQCHCGPQTVFCNPFCSNCGHQRCANCHTVKMNP